MALRKVGNAIQTFFGQLTISAPSAGGAALVINGAAAAAVAVMNGGDVAGLNINSTATTNRSQISLQQAGVAVSRIGIDGTQSLLSDSTNGDTCIVAVSQAIRLGTVVGGTTKVLLASAGNVTVAAPTSGVTLGLAAVSGGAGLLVTMAGSGSGVVINGPAATQLNAISIQQTAQAQWFIYQPSSSSDLRFFTGSDRFVLTAAGNLTVNTPTSGVALTVNGATGSQAMLVSAAAGQQAVVATSGADFTGILINGAQNNVSLTINNTQTGASANWRLSSSATGSGFGAGSLVIGTGSSAFVTVFSDGGVTCGAPTGGDKGVGTINATGLFVNGVAVGTGSVSSVTGTANQITCTPTTGAVVVSLPQNIVIPTVTGGIAMSITTTSTGLPLSLNSDAGVAALNMGSTSANPAYTTFLPNAGISASSFIGASGAANQIITGSAAGDMNIKAGGALNFACNNVSTLQFSMTDTGGMFASGQAAQGRGTLNANQVYVSAVPLYRTGSFTGTFTGVSTIATATVNYAISGQTASLTCGFTGTSNATTFTMTGLPAVLQPTSLNQRMPMAGTDNSVGVMLWAEVIAASGTITFYRDILATGAFSASGFTASGTKGWNTASITYFLN